MYAFMCWKLVDINFTAIEKSDGFGILTSMFVNLGQRALTECVTENTIKDSSFSLLK